MFFYIMVPHRWLLLTASDISSEDCLVFFKASLLLAITSPELECSSAQQLAIGVNIFIIIEMRCIEPIRIMHVIFAPEHINDCGGHLGYVSIRYSRSLDAVECCCIDFGRDSPDLGH